MSIRSKLKIGFLAVALTAAVIGVLSYRATARMQAQIDEITLSNLDEIDGAAEVADSVHGIKSNVRRLIAEARRGRQPDTKYSRKVFQQDAAIIDREMARWRKGIQAAQALAERREEQEEEEEEEEELIALDKMNSMVSIFVRQNIKFFEIYEEKGIEAADVFFETEMEGHSRDVKASLTEMRRHLTEEIRELADRAKEIHHDALRTTLIATVMSLILTFVIGWLFSSTIGGNLLALTDAVGSIGTGNFHEEVRLESNDEFQVLADAMNKMARDLATSQAAMLRAEKMAAVGQLAGGLAHEINNPIGIILGFAQSVARGVNGDDPLSLPLRSIEREAIRCKELVQNLLAFSRSSAPEHREETDLNTCVKQALSLVLPQAKVKEVEVLQELDPEPPRLTANKIQIQQVIINLCNNAIDAMPKGGNLTVRTGHAPHNGGATAWLEIADTGMGIPKNLQSRIFEPFFTTKEVGKGTGLGLALVHGIIMKYGGEIELSSEEGKGTKFSISFPAQAGKPDVA